MFESEAAKVDSMPKNGILGQILQVKKSMLAILKRFEILYILSYLQWFCSGKFSALALIFFLIFWKF